MTEPENLTPMAKEPGELLAREMCVLIGYDPDIEVFREECLVIGAPDGPPAKQMPRYPQRLWWLYLPLAEKLIAAGYRKEGGK